MDSQGKASCAALRSKSGARMCSVEPMSTMYTMPTDTRFDICTRLTQYSKPYYTRVDTTFDTRFKT